MKKIMLFMLFLSTFWGHSQVKNYTFTQTTGTYTEITGGTLLGSTTIIDTQRFVDPAAPAGASTATGVGFPLGFNFTFNGFVYDRFAVLTDGWISLGSSTLSPAVNTTTTSSTTPISSTFSVTPEVLGTKISALATDLTGQTGSSLRFETVGTAPNKVLVVQWKNFKKANVTGDSFDFQIRLYETSNKVEIVYGKMVRNSATTTTYQVGLRAEPSATATNYTNRLSTTGWDVTTQGTLATDTVLMNDVLKPLSGLTYTWMPPVCGGAKPAGISAITSSGATLNWDSYIPAPTGYEYIVTTATALPTGSGTTTASPTVNVTGLNPNTIYNVFVKSVCGTDIGSWALIGTFKTKCMEATSIFEDFDSYPATSTSMPDCWSIAGNGSTYITSSGATVGSVPNRLYMYASSTLNPPTVTYAILPVLSNLQSATYRLKFKAICTGVNRTFQVGYFSSGNDVSTFTLLQTINLPSYTTDSALEFVVTPAALPSGVKNLVFKNAGTGAAAGSTSIYIDDILWEPIPPCLDVKSISVKNVMSTSATLLWTVNGTETAWQYVYAPSTVKVYTGLTPVDVNATTAALSGLTAATSYNVWVRSKCGADSYGAWIGAMTFTTACTPVPEFVNNFDASSSSLPSCWGKATTGNATIGQTAPASSPNALWLYNSSDTSRGIAVMEPVSNAAAATHRLKFKLRGSAIGNSVEVGYLKDINDVNSFEALQSFTATSNTLYDNIFVSFGATPTTPYLAFRATGTNSNSSVYIDDVIWEPIPDCADITALSVALTASDFADVGWTATGAENQWQYAVGAPGTINPYTLNAIDFASAPTVNQTTVSGRITGLTPSSSYKIWIRSKCSAGVGVWVGPLSIATTCSPTDGFTQNFDAGAAYPSCWSRVGTLGTAAISAIAGGSSPNVLNLGASAVFAMQPVSNSADGTNVLRFKFHGTVANSVIEVGYVKNIGDAASFSKITSFTAPSITDFLPVTAVLGYEPGSQVLAFRNPSGTVYIDDVVWEPAPTCLDVTAVGIDLLTSSSLDLNWTVGSSETKWQYAIGTSADSNPSTLTAVDFVGPIVPGTKVKGTINSLTPSTSYKVWVRSKCSTSILGTWIGPISFTTNCAPSTEFSQNFDASTAFPTCWSKVGSTGTVKITPLAGASSPNVLSIGSTSLTARGFVAMQPVSNADSGTYRLKFKLRGSIANAVLDIGYLTNPSDPNSFNLFESITASTVDFENKVSLVVTSPNKQVLAFRNPGTISSTIYVDNVVWEPIPVCPDIKKVATNGTTSNTANLTVTTDGSATAWQYVIGTSTDTDPSTLTLANITSSSFTLTALTPATTYKIWVRSKCDTSVGLWSDPLTFITTCVAVTGFAQNFDANTNMPDCWNKVGPGTVTVGFLTGASVPNTLSMYNVSTSTAKGIVALPSISNATTGTNRLKFKFRSSITNGVLELGYVTDINDPASFVMLESYVSNSTTVFQDKMTILPVKPISGGILAFRNPGVSTGYIYVDDVIWEPIPACIDVVNVVVKLPTTTSIQLSWDSTGTETAWQYAIAPSTVTTPATLPSTSIFDVTSKAITVAGLTPNTSYKIWVRSNCGSGAYGAWIETPAFVTPCPPVGTIAENFDASLTLPNCWFRVIAQGNISVASSTLNGTSNALRMVSQSAGYAVWTAIPPVSTAVSPGGYRMKFKYKSDTAGTVFQICSISDPMNLVTSGATNFTILKTVPVTATNTVYTFDDFIPATTAPYLAFRIYHASSVTTVDIDDFAYELPSVATVCATGITAVPNATCGNFATTISWAAAANAAGYRLTIGTTSGGSDVANNLELGSVLTYSFKGKVSTTYYYTVKPYNGLGDATGCAEQTVTTAANNCFCTSTPTSNDGTGITKIELGETSFTNADVTYKDFTATQINLTQGASSNLKLTFATTTLDYNSTVWIDFNDNYELEPSEIVATGISGTTSPNILNLSFVMPATAQLGTHGMRIVSTNTIQTPANPCYAGVQGVTLDFKVNIDSTTPVLGVDPFESNNFSYYPNPVTDVLNLSFNSEISNVSVMNLLGQQVISKSLNANQGKIDMTGLSKGAYLVKVTVGNQSKTIKVIKE